MESLRAKAGDRRFESFSWCYAGVAEWTIASFENRNSTEGSDIRHRIQVDEDGYKISIWRNTQIGEEDALEMR